MLKQVIVRHFPSKGLCQLTLLMLKGTIMGLHGVCLRGMAQSRIVEL